MKLLPRIYLNLLILHDVTNVNMRERSINIPNLSAFTKHNVLMTVIRPISMSPILAQVETEVLLVNMNTMGSLEIEIPATMIWILLSIRQFIIGNRLY